MRRRDFYWSLFHSGEKRQIDDLKTEYVEVVYEVIPVADHPQWLVWREGFRSWKPLADFPALLVSLRDHAAAGSAQPAPPSARAIATVIGSNNPAGAAVKDKNIKTTTAADPRTSVQTRLERANQGIDDLEFGISDETNMDDRDTRYPKKWEVRIQMGGAKAIVLQTVDVSNRGMHLKDALPKGLPNYFNIELRALDQVLPMVCSEVKTPDGSASKRLRIEVNHHANTLQTLLLT